MKKRDLEKAGIPRGKCMESALQAAVKALRTDMNKREVLTYVGAVAQRPGAFKDDPLFGALARQLADVSGPANNPKKKRCAPWRSWGNNIDNEAMAQMNRSCALPVAERGALMPDAHVGYGLPIGGVLAVRGAVIPYAVGVDIACRMKMTVLDLPVSVLVDDLQRLKEVLTRETLFGVGAAFRKKHDHQVMEMDWSISPVTAGNKDLAWGQLGTSGSGNHFVEFGTLTVERLDAPVPPGTYLALLSHSGSRGIGSKVASHYSRLAMQNHPELPRESRHLAWLDLDSPEGAEYWKAMELMGLYAAANHEIIHKKIVTDLAATVVCDIENHHNFAWKERHNDRELIVHRKGATPAGQGAIGIIPGSMGTPGFVVRGKGNTASLCSAAHGAGRLMSRTAAKQRYRWNDAREILEAAGVTVLSAGLDELPMVYKDIHAVMAAQTDLVDPVARFDPKIVKMAAPGERAED